MISEFIFMITFDVDARSCEDQGFTLQMFYDIHVNTCNQCLASECLLL